MLPELLSQERPFEPQEASFSKSGLLDDDYVYDDLKSITEKDEKLGAFMEALKIATSGIAKRFAR